MVEKKNFSLFSHQSQCFVCFYSACISWLYQYVLLFKCIVDVINTLRWNILDTVSRTVTCACFFETLLRPVLAHYFTHKYELSVLDTTQNSSEFTTIS